MYGEKIILIILIPGRKNSSNTWREIFLISIGVLER